VAVTFDLEGGCRIYDLLRLKKTGKLSSSNLRDGADLRFQVNLNRWRMLPEVAVACTLDAVVAVTMAQETAWEGEGLCEREVLVDGLYADEREAFRSLGDILQQQPEKQFVF